MAGQNYVSDELTHFVGRGLCPEKQCPEKQFQLFIEILRTGWLRASYRVEFGANVTVMADPRKPLTGNESVRAAALCFCDVPFNDLAIHMEKFSTFGLAFTKLFMMSRGASPVFYVAKNAAPPPAPGIGPRTLGEKFQLLRNELADLCWQMDQYVNRENPDSASGLRLTSKFSAAGTPEDLRILGKLHALASDLDQMVFAHLKFFDGRLAENHLDNFYMEREWRKIDGLAFRLDDVKRVVVPLPFVSRFKQEFPDYVGMINNG
jgi:hypothetical protein